MPFDAQLMLLYLSQMPFDAAIMPVWLNRMAFIAPKAERKGDSRL